MPRRDFYGIHPAAAAAAAVRSHPEGVRRLPPPAAATAAAAFSPTRMTLRSAAAAAEAGERVPFARMRHLNVWHVTNERANDHERPSSDARFEPGKGTGLAVS